MSDTTPFHAGEQAVQRRMGVLEEIEPWARRVVRDHLPDSHREFYRALPFLVVAARDRSGRPWVTLLAGRPGFADSPDPGRLRIDAHPAAGDALEGELGPGAELGVLGIELSTRRRNRVNGRIESSVGGLELRVDQSFGNCPQYIRERQWHWAEPVAARPPARRIRTFDPALRERVESADAFFIASGHRGEGESAAYGMDASHRGGEPGFVRVLDDRRLVFPDYAGNNHYNTIGNLVMDDRAGLVFVDFATGGMLQLTGRVTIDWDSPEVAEHPGARRLVILELDEAVDLPAALPLRWSDEGGAVRTLRLVERRRESEDVVSFVFHSRDGGELPDFEPGQHLPVELRVEGADATVKRTYSLSNAPGEGAYRISVKREPRGMASRLLHDALEEGAFVEARSPAGDFVLLPGSRPVALVSAGIGLTPMLSMLRDLAGREDARPVSFVHVARDGDHHPLAQEVRELARGHAPAEAHVFYSRPGAGDVQGRDYDRTGRPDPEMLASLLPADADVYLCGPVAFMAEVQQGLEEHGFASERIHSESFGPRG